MLTGVGFLRNLYPYEFLGSCIRVSQTLEVFFFIYLIFSYKKIKR